MPDNCNNAVPLPINTPSAVPSITGVGDNATDFAVGYVLVQNEKRLLNFANIYDGSFLFPHWVTDATHFKYTGMYYYTAVNDNGSMCCIDAKGRDITREIYNNEKVSSI